MRKAIQLLFAITITATLSGCLCCNLSQNLNTIENAAQTQNTKECDSMDETMRSICYSTIAVSSGNTSICDKIQGEDLNIGCYISVAVQNDDPSICGKIRLEDAKESCILQIAARTRDKEVCNSLTQESKRQECAKEL